MALAARAGLASDAHAMIRELRAYAILNGARGKPPGDIDALADAIVAMSAMALDLAPGLKEFDINPLFVLPAGKGVRAGDALARCQRPPTPQAAGAPTPCIKASIAPRRWSDG